MTGCGPRVTGSPCGVSPTEEAPTPGRDLEPVEPQTVFSLRLVCNGAACGLKETPNHAVPQGPWRCDLTHPAAARRVRGYTAKSCTVTSHDQAPLSVPAPRLACVLTSRGTTRALHDPGRAVRLRKPGST